MALRTSFLNTLRGATLRSHIDANDLDNKRSIDIAIDIAKGLAEAHSKGVIHRDIKPSNIIINNQGIAKILDFGIAKLESKTAITSPGYQPGTKDYMSPEQLRGEDVDHRTDIWSFGLIFQEMLTGNLSKEVQSISKSLDIQPNVSTLLRSVLGKCLSKRHNRYSSMHSLLADLHEIKNAINASGANQQSLFKPFPGSTKYHYVVGIVILACTVLGAFFIKQGQPILSLDELEPTHSDSTLSFEELNIEKDDSLNDPKETGIVQDTTRVNPKKGERNRNRESSNSLNKSGNSCKGRPSRTKFQSDIFF